MIITWIMYVCARTLFILYLSNLLHAWVDRNLLMICLFLNLSILFWCCGSQVPKPAGGHGRMMDPPARNSMWRFGYPNPVNYNDNELFCGGYAGTLKNYDAALITLYSVRSDPIRYCHNAKTSFWPLDQWLSGCADFDTGINLSLQRANMQSIQEFVQ